MTCGETGTALASPYSTALLDKNRDEFWIITRAEDVEPMDRTFDAILQHGAHSVQRHDIKDRFQLLDKKSELISWGMTSGKPKGLFLSEALGTCTCSVLTLRVEESASQSVILGANETTYDRLVGSAETENRWRLKKRSGLNSII